AGRQIDVELRDAGVGTRRGDLVVVLEAPEVERLVLHERTAAVDAGLLLIKRRDHPRVEVRGVVKEAGKVILAEISETGSGKGFGARLGDRVDPGPVDAAVLGVVPVREHLELGHVLLAVLLVGSAAALVADVDTVDLVLRHIAAGRAGLYGAGIPA